MIEPLISVILPVYFGERYLRESVESILTQTFTDFEFIIFDDGSGDGSRKILESYDDPRIRLVFQENAGLPETLNRAIALCKGRYIARQDHDDISLPTRLEKQITFLETHPHCGLVGTGANIWVEDEISQRGHDHPSESKILRLCLLFNNPFVHSSLMFRRAVFEDVGNYSTDPARQPPEDYELISRVSRQFELANLEERLVIYRETENSMSSVIRPEMLQKNNLFQERLALIAAENIEFESGGIKPSSVAIDFGNIVHPCEESYGGFISPFNKILIILTKSIANIFDYDNAKVPWALINLKVYQLYVSYCLYTSSLKGDGSYFHKIFSKVAFKIRIRLMPPIYQMICSFRFRKIKKNTRRK